MVAKATEHIPYHLVYVTAYSEHALSAFETKVVDYLLKPVRQSRLERCLEKIKALPPLVSPAVEEEILVHDGKTTYRLTESDISYIESIGRYQQVSLTASGQRKFQLQTIVTEETMTNFENELSTEQFLRVHRSFIVNVGLITQVQREARNTLLSLSGVSQAIPVARAKVAVVNEYLK
ncbi:two-component system response regulator [Vibrio maritimus]|uniref:Two-component system response regulator n=1 Tax=Vibrio maritimus TaxID=990268 RepID=A0A090U1B2_9VIBR|nr:two-component system response regulator [Vibrio maritimus]